MTQAMILCVEGKNLVLHRHMVWQMPKSSLGAFLAHFTHLQAIYNIELMRKRHDIKYNVQRDCAIDH